MKNKIIILHYIMSAKYVKLPSRQGGVVSNNSLLDFDIPDYGNYDLSKSYISIMANVATTEPALQVGGDTDPIGVHSITCNNAGSYPFRNNVFIGDYSISSDKVGNIDDVMSSNVINTNLDVFGRDFEQMNSENYKQLHNFKDSSYALNTPSIGSIFRELTKNGPSRELPFELKVPLNSFSSFCDTSIYGGKGRTRIHAQLKTDSVVGPAELNPYPNPVFVECANTADAALQLVTEAYYGSFGGMSNTNEIRVNGTRTVGGAFVNIFVTLTGPPVAAGGGTWNIPVTTTGTAITNPRISFAYAPAAAAGSSGIVACDNIANGVVQNYVTVTAPVDLTILTIIGSLDAYTALIGRPVIIDGTNLIGDADPTAATGTSVGYTLTDVVLENAYSTTTSKVRLYLDKYLLPRAAAAITAITIQSTNISLMPPTFADIVNGPAAGINPTTLTCNNLTSDQLLLWANQRVVVYGLNNLVYFRKTLLVQNIQGLNVTFNAPVVAIAVNTNATRMTLATLASNTQTLTYSNPNLVLRELLSVSIPPPIAYTKFTVERGNIPTGTLSWNKMFSIDPNVQNLYALVLNNAELISDNVIASYRWKVNNVDKFQRDIVKDSSLEKDNTIAVFSSSSKKLQSLIKSYGTNGANAIAANLPIRRQVFIPMCHLQAGQMNNVQLTLTFMVALANDKLFYLIKEGNAQI